MITQQKLKELFRYEEDTGIFIWKDVNANPMMHGRIAGTNVNGYTRIKIKEKAYYAHRLAWLYIYGKWPKNYIDHLDGDKSNNRIENLRDVDCSTNMENLKNSNSDKQSCLPMGVSISKNGAENKYKSSLTLKGKYIYLGVHPTAEAAHEAYIKAKRNNKKPHMAGLVITAPAIQ